MGNVLFVCTVNKHRSRTAEEIFKNHPNHAVKSAGTDPSATVPITAELVEWADYIIVMEKHHRNRVQKKFKLGPKRLIVLHIADEYEFMDLDLVDLLKQKLGGFFA